MVIGSDFNAGIGDANYSSPSIPPESWEEGFVHSQLAPAQKERVQGELSKKELTYSETEDLIAWTKAYPSYAKECLNPTVLPLAVQRAKAGEPWGKDFTPGELFVLAELVKSNPPVLTPEERDSIIKLRNMPYRES